MIKVKCACCGRIYEAKTSRSIYCSDRCRSKAYKAEQSKHKSKQPQKIASNTANRNGTRTPADRMIAAMHKYGKHSIEYWREYQQYMLEYGSSCNVNGVSILDPDFAEKASYAIINDGMIKIE